MRAFPWGPVGQAVKFSKDVAVKCHQILTLLRTLLATCNSGSTWIIITSSPKNESEVCCFPRWVSKTCYLFSHPEVFLLNNKSNHQEMKQERGTERRKQVDREWDVSQTASALQPLIRHHSFSTPLLRQLGLLTQSPAVPLALKQKTSLRKFSS